MELIIIFIISEIIAGVLSFTNMNGDIVSALLSFIILGGLGSIIITMRLHDFLLYRATTKKQYKKAIRMYKNKYKITPNTKSRNGILLNLVPFYFMVDDNENAIKNIKEVDFLTLKKPILKSYYQLLMAYSKYLENNFEKINDYLDSAISYEPLAKTVADLLKIAISIKENPDNNIIEKFKELPNDLDEFYFEPFDKLYIELEKKLGIS